MKNILLSAALCSGLIACGETQKASDTKEQAVPYQITANSLASHIKTLASDEFGGRAPGTKGEELTVDYISSVFQEAGVLPGNGDSYVQEVPLVSIELQGTPALTLKGTETSLNFTYRQDQVIWSRKETEAVAITDSDLVFVGYGINAPERGWNDYDGIDVTGKTVVMLVNDPGYATQDDTIFNGNSMTYYGRWDYKFDEAARQGAAAAIIIHDTLPASYPWSTVASSWTGPQFDIVRADKGASLATVEGWVTVDAADKLFEAAGLDRIALSKAAENQGFKAVPMPLKASTSFENNIKHLTSKNVAGLIKGSKNPDEIFIYMAHWDHLGTDPTIDGDGIYNGAHDNASGTGGLLELAKAFATSETKPERSILFLAVAAEEQGLLGSAYYAANPLYPLSQTVGGINMDGMNYIGRTKDVSVIGLGNSELDTLLEKAATAQDRVLVADQEPEKGYFYRSDHFELSKLGVPMLYPNAGYDHLEKGYAYGKAKADEYVANDYHAPSDEYDPSWDLSGAVEDLNLYYTTGRMVIDSAFWPNWNEGTEFKAIRDQQRSGK